MDKMEKFLHKIGAYRLKDLVRAIRACKTAAAERAVIAKESAFIRTSIKEDTGSLRYINVSKLLYIHMLGYPAHFGQLECLKLAASTKFTDKKLGYLGIMMLLDENQDILTLVTNSLQNDLNSPNPFVVSLALCTLGNIASLDMTRDLTGDIERLLGTSNTYIKKKAILCALRIVKKNSDTFEVFAPIAKNLLNERNHGVILTGSTLIIELCSINEEFRLEMQQTAIPVLIKHMKNLSTAGYSSEHDVNGVTDPFLQVKLLKLMGILGKGSAEASDLMNDTLAQVATNTESARNVGNAILYECVLTIMEIQSDSSLRVLAINILAKFLSNKDNNIRYVGLTTLTRTSTQSTSAAAQQANVFGDDLMGLGTQQQQNTQSSTAVSDSNALQRHRAIILDCLKDGDVSIRKRALDLAFLLITKDNIRILTRELLAFLEVCEKDIKVSVSSRLVDYASRFRPNKRWLADTIIRTLRVAGAYVDQGVVNSFIKLVSSKPDANDSIELNKYVVRKLFNLLFNEVERAFEQEGLVIAAVWCIGEYGDILVQGANESTKNTYFVGKGIYLHEDERKKRFAALANPLGNLNMDGSRDSLDDGYGDLIDSDANVSDDKPALQDKDILIDIFDNLSSNPGGNSTTSAMNPGNSGKPAGKSGATAAADLFDIFSSPSPATSSTGPINAATSQFSSLPAASNGASHASKPAANNANLLDDLFGPSSSTGSNASKPAGSNGLDDLLGGFGSSSQNTMSSGYNNTKAAADPLADLLGGFGSSSSAPKPVTSTTNNGMGSFDNIWSNEKSSGTPVSAAAVTTPANNDAFGSMWGAGSTTAASPAAGTNLMNHNNNAGTPQSAQTPSQPLAAGTPSTPNTGGIDILGLVNSAAKARNTNTNTTNASSAVDASFGANDDDSTDDMQKIPTEDVVLDMLETVLKASKVSDTVREYAITCLLKLASRLRSDAASKPRIVSLIKRFDHAQGLELQVRAVEAGVVLESLSSVLVDTVTERIPILETSAGDVGGYN